MDQGIFAPIFFAMIGSWGRAVIAWALDNPIPVTGLLGTWLLIFASSKWQLNRLQTRTNQLILSEAKKLLEQKPDITVKQFFEALQPAWLQMVRSSAWFIPHRWELWPLPATPQRVTQRLDFNPDWVGEVLWLNEIKMRGAKPRENLPELSPLEKIQKGFK